jgi:hypothetical protein
MVAERGASNFSDTAADIATADAVPAEHTKSGPLCRCDEARSFTLLFSLRVIRMRRARYRAVRNAAMGFNSWLNARSLPPAGKGPVGQEHLTPLLDP